MKTKMICTSLLAGVFLVGTAFAQTKSGGVSGISVTPRNGISPVVPPGTTVQSGTTVQNGNAIQNGTAVQNGINGQSKTANGQFTTTSNSLAGMGTNSLAGTNGLNGTNNFVGTNGLGNANNVTAQVNPERNFPVTAATNFNGNVVVPDQAVTPSDRILLTTLSEGVRASLRIAPEGVTPVHFLIQNGTVTVVGTVQSTAQSQAVISQVQQTPGVLSVINDMHVRGAFAPAVQNANSGALGLGAPTDRAFSAADQTLLTTVQQEASAQLGVTSLAQMPVHFSIQNGVIGVTGQVNSLQEKQALIAALERTQGTVRVVDNVTVTPSSSVSVSGVSGGFAAPSSTTPNGLAPNVNQSATGTFVGPSSATPNGLTPTSRGSVPFKNSAATNGFVGPSSATPNGLTPTSRNTNSSSGIFVSPSSTTPNGVTTPTGNGATTTNNSLGF